MLLQQGCWHYKFIFPRKRSLNGRFPKKMKAKKKSIFFIWPNKIISVISVSALTPWNHFFLSFHFFFFFWGKLYIQHILWMASSFLSWTWTWKNGQCCDKTDWLTLEEKQFWNKIQLSSENIKTECLTEFFFSAAYSNLFERK